MTKTIYTIPAGALDPDNKLTTCAGDNLDVLGNAGEYGDYDDCWSNNLDYFSESMAQALKEYDWTDALLDALNDARSEKARRALLEQAGEDAQEYAGILAAWRDPAQRLKLGAFIALQHPDMFARMLDAWRDNQSDIASGLGGYDDRPGLYPPLVKELERWYESLEDELMRDFLRGDYGRNHDGLERAIARKYGLESVDYSRKDDSVTIEYDPESGDLQEKSGAFSDALDDAGLDPNTTKDDAACMKAAQAFDWPAAINAAIVRDAGYYIAKEREKREKRRAENEKTSAYQQERRDEAEVARIAKLRAMTK